MIKEKTIYVLIKKDVPVIKGKRVISDARVGGEKLVYQLTSYYVRVFKLFWLFNIYIPLILYRKRKGLFGLDIRKSTVVYLRPYKKNWTQRKEKQPFHLWGKKDHPLTNIWMELEYDYMDIMKSSPLIKTRIDENENQLLIKFLRKHAEKFVLINQSKTNQK